MVFGLTDQGFNPARLEDVRLAIIDDFKDAFGQNIQTESDSVFGQFAGIFAERFADLWEASEDVYTAAYIGSATGQSLDDLVALAGVSRLGATFSVVVLRLSGTPGTIVPALSVARDPITLTRWVTAAEATIGGGGTVDVNASPESVGAVIALAGSLTEIVTPVTGWASVTNALDAAVGRIAQTDASLRTTFIAAFRIGGGSSDGAIRAVLLQIADVTEVTIVSNRSDVVDADGRPPKSFEAIVRGGVDQAIFDALWLAAPAGIEIFGTNASGFAVDTQGKSQPVAFTRPVSIDIFIVVIYEALTNPPTDIESLAQAEILELGTTFTTGQDVVPFEFIQTIETTGFKTMTFNVGFSAGPTFNDTLVISARQLAAFDSSRVSFTRTN